MRKTPIALAILLIAAMGAGGCQLNASVRSDDPPKQSNPGHDPNGPGNSENAPGHNKKK